MTTTTTVPDAASIRPLVAGASPPTPEEIYRLRRVAAGQEVADLAIRGGHVVHVHTAETRAADVLVHGRHIAAVVEPGRLRAANDVDVDWLSARRVDVHRRPLPPRVHDARARRDRPPRRRPAGRRPCSPTRCASPTCSAPVAWTWSPRRAPRCVVRPSHAGRAAAGTRRPQRGPRHAGRGPRTGDPPVGGERRGVQPVQPRRGDGRGALGGDRRRQAGDRPHGATFGRTALGVRGRRRGRRPQRGTWRRSSSDSVRGRSRRCKRDR